MQIIFIISLVNHYLNKPKGSVRIYRKTKRISVIRFHGNAVCPYVWKYWNTNKPNKKILLCLTISSLHLIYKPLICIIFKLSDICTQRCHGVSFFEMP